MPRLRMSCPARTSSPGPTAAASAPQVMYTLIQTARLNGIDPQAWLADVLARINDHRITDLAALLPGRWAAEMEPRRLAADAIARLKITLDEVKVAVLRWIEVPLAISECIGDNLDLKWSTTMNSPEQSRRGRNACLDDPPQIVRDLPEPAVLTGFQLPAIRLRLSAN